MVRQNLHLHKQYPRKESLKTYTGQFCVRRSCHSQQCQTYLVDKMQFDTIFIKATFIMSAFSFSAPQFTEQDSMRERASMTDEERQQIKSECLGQSISILEETPEMIEDAMQAMARHLAAIEDKPAYDKALLLVPHLVEQESSFIRFLRCERFCTEKAARRLVKYWEMRTILFGIRAFLPMRLDGALQDDVEIMKAIPEAYFVTGKDDHGRIVLVSNKSRLDFSRHDRMSVNRCVWYHIHNHLEDIDVQKRGIVTVGYFKINSPKQFDRIQAKLFIAMIRDALPIRWVCVHICHALTFFNVVYPMLKFLMGKEIRLRTKTHYGSEEKILKELEQFGIHRNIILKSMGGNYDIKIEEWLTSRQQAESNDQQFIDQVSEDTHDDTTEAH